jgi:hypothetical protein
MKRIYLLFLPILLLTCYLPVSTTKSPALPVETITPIAEEACAFVEGRKTLNNVSEQLLDMLTSAALSVESARAEAYGENCITADGSVAHFAARETDFYVTLTVADLANEAELGNLLEQTLAVIDQLLIDQMPGPNPGYVGITFKASEQVQNLWFMQTEATELRKQGLKGTDLYRALKEKP